MCEKYDARTYHKNSRNTRHVCQAKQKVTKSEFEKVVMKNSSQARSLKFCPQVREYLVIRPNCNFKSRNGSRREHSSWPWKVSCPSWSTYSSSSQSQRAARQAADESKKLQLQQLEEKLLQLKILQQTWKLLWLKKLLIKQRKKKLNLRILG